MSFSCRKKYIIYNVHCKRVSPAVLLSDIYTLGTWEFFRMLEKFLEHLAAPYPFCLFSPIHIQVLHHKLYFKFLEHLFI